MQCKNNLKQLALGCDNYHTTHNHMPPGTITGSTAAVGDRLGLFVSLLPHIEQQNLFNSLDLKQGWESATNQPITAEACRIFRCPAESRLDLGAFTNYVGVAGKGEDAATLDAQDSRRGFFAYERTVKLKEVTDGTANTLLLIETSQQPGRWAAGGPASVRGVEVEAVPLIGKDGAFGTIHSASDWNLGRIKPTANAALGDGSVRALPSTIRPELLAALATIAGGEPIQGEW
jgi:hypothetical protein